MNSCTGKTISFLGGWIRDEDGTALIEATLMFPTLLVMLFGIFDVGNAITVNHKMITASQVVADLVTRDRTVTDDQIDDAIEAARLTMQPYATSQGEFGVDIVSVEYDEDDEPVQLWRETRGTTEQENLVEKTTGLGTDGEGVVAVTIVYDYEPTFGNFVISAYRMRETAFARGRRSSTVTHE